MARYEKVTAKAVELAECHIDGNTVRTVTGKVGGKINEKSTTYQTERMAASRFERAIEGFKKKGMVHQSERHEPVENAELERAIFEHPDDDAPRIVYGDWLQEQGDPRGELVAIQRQADKKAKKREKELLATHGSWLYGPLDEMLHVTGVSGGVRRPKIRVTWRLGFMDELELRLSDWDDLISKTLDSVSKQHSARFLRKLTLGSASSFTKCIAVLATGWPKTLRSLCINGQLWGEYTPQPHKNGSLVAFCKAHPELEELSLRLGDEELQLDLPKLRVLDLIWGGIRKKHIDGLKKAKWPQLHTLGFTITNTGKPDVTTLFDPKLFPKLAHLQLGYVRDAKSAQHIAHAISSKLKLETLTLVECDAACVKLFEAELAKSKVALSTAKRES